MATSLILVNGLPGSGKTTLADALAALGGYPLLVKDRIKEGLAPVLGGPSVSLGPIAMDTAWAAAGQLPGTVVLDSWWFRPRDLGQARAGLARTGATRVVEVWCSAGNELTRLRYRDRVRDPLHRDSERLADWDLRELIS